MPIACERKERYITKQIDNVHLSYNVLKYMKYNSSASDKLLNE